MGKALWFWRRLGDVSLTQWIIGILGGSTMSVWAWIADQPLWFSALAGLVALAALVIILERLAAQKNEKTKGHPDIKFGEIDEGRVSDNQSSSGRPFLEVGKAKKFDVQKNRIDRDAGEGEA